MKANVILVSLLLACLSGCGGNTTLQGTFEQQMKMDKVNDFNLIHIEEWLNFGLVLFNSWTEAYPRNRNRHGTNAYEEQDSHWISRPGTSCDSGGIFRLGLVGNHHLFCSAQREYMPSRRYWLTGTRPNCSAQITACALGLSSPMTMNKKLSV